jgi:hypothetical protein
MRIVDTFNEHRNPTYFSPGKANLSGQEIAEYTLDRCSPVWYDEKMDLLPKGLAAITESPNSTPNEKAVAELGMRFDNMEDPMIRGRVHDRKFELCDAQTIVMENIASGTTGPVGSVLAQIALETGYESSYTTSSKVFHEEGFNSIAQAPDVSDMDKNIAELGSKLNSYFDHRGNSEASGVIFKKIISEPDEPVVNVIAGLAVDVEDEFYDAEKSTEFLDDAFNIIGHSSAATPEEKMLARMRFDVEDMFTNAEEIRENKLEIMNTLKEEQTPIERRDAVRSLDREFEKQLATNDKMSKKANDKMSKKAMEQYIEKDEDTVDVTEDMDQKQEQLPLDTEGKVMIGDTLVSKRKQGPPPPEIGLFQIKKEYQVNQEGNRNGNIQLSSWF